jgi:DNA repair protein RecN (Recombination protein N)
LIRSVKSFTGMKASHDPFVFRRLLMSLKRIALRDFVIVRELELDLGRGFTVLTGETGAGKSILIDALQLALGARSDAGVIREGAQRCEVSVEFDNQPGLQKWLQSTGFEANETLLLRRTIDTQGKSRAWINGSVATVSQLKDVAEKLVDIHGQHAWQSLTRPESVRRLLDAYAGVNLSALNTFWAKWRTAQKMLTEARTAQDSLQREVERLTWQISEVDKLSPGIWEWEELNTQHSRLSNAQTLRSTVQTAVDALVDAEVNATTLIGKAVSALESAVQFEPQFAAIVEVLSAALAQAEDAAHSLNGYARHAELEPERLAELDERIALWINLSRRYKRQPADLPGLAASWRDELEKLNAAADLEALEQAEKLAKEVYLAEAKVVSRMRAKSAPALSKEISKAMQGLGMQGGKFEVALSQSDQPTQHGLEHVEFLVAGHTGITPKAIGKVASGGELSRIALAIAVTTSQLGEAQTLIFDEVDSGVGGAVAETVGKLMNRLGKDRQVMAVTHLPQVAARSDHHLVVAKRTDGGKTFSTVDPALGPARVAEIARMLGGQQLSDTTLAHAREMLG